MATRQPASLNLLPVSASGVGTRQLEQVPSPAHPARYVLQPGLNLIADAQGGVLLCLRPLLALRVNEQAASLLSALRCPHSIAELAATRPGMTPAAIAAFLDPLVQRRLLTRQPAAMTFWPLVSIIVPAHGRAAATRRCVQSLLALDYPAHLREIIVVDDASTPPLAEVLHDLPITLLRQEANIGQSAARNLAAAQASGHVLALIDNDCVAEPDWLKALLPYLDDPAVAIIGGRVTALPAPSVIALFEAVRSPLDMGAVATEVTPTAAVSYLPTCNLLVRREVLLAQGGFNPTLRVGEDVDFIWRTLRSGHRAYYVPAGCVVHDHRVQWRDWLRRRADYGSSEADLQQRYPEGRRLMHLPRVILLLLLSVVLVPYLGSAGLWPVVIAVMLFGIELIKKQRGLWRIGVKLSVASIVIAVGREHLAALYHLSTNAMRYYSLPLLVIGGMQPYCWSAIILLFTVAPLADVQRLHPRLAIGTFIGLYGLELIAYQWGVWRGCWQQRTLSPLLPCLHWRR